MRFLATIVLFASSALACAAAPAAEPIRRTAVVRVPTRPLAPAWRAFVLPDAPPRYATGLNFADLFATRIHRVESDDPATEPILAGSLRATVHGSDVRFADDLAFAPIVANAREGANWFFATADGALFRSEGFLGPLVRVGETNGVALDLGYTSAGRLVALAHDHTFWTGGPDGRFVPLAPPSGPGWIDLGFVTSTLGYGITEPGVLVRTRDGGASFEAVPTPNAAPYIVLPDTTGVTLATTAGPFRIDGERGSLASVPAFTRPPAPVASEAEILRDRWLEHDPLAAMTLLANGRAFDAGDDATVTQSAGNVIVMRPGRPLFLSFAPGLTLQPGPGDCALAPLGDRVVSVCSSGGETRIDALQPTGGWQRLRTLQPARPLTLGATGTRVLALGGGCDPNDAPSPDTICWSDGTRWIKRHLPPQRSSTVVAGPWVIFRADTSPSAPWNWVRVDDRNAPAELQLEPADVRVIGIEAVPLVGVSVTARMGSETVAGVGDPANVVVLHTLPPGAESAHFADAEHGIAVGPRLDTLFSTDDGGTSWTPLALPLEGDAGSVSIARARVRGSETACTSRGCWIAGRIFWGPSPAEPPRAFAAMHAPRDITFAQDPPWPSRIFPLAVHCDTSGRARAIPPPPDGDVASRAFAPPGWTDRIASADATVDQDRFRVRWSGVDARGRFEATSGVASAARLHAVEGYELGPAQLIAVWMDRTRFVGEYCAATWRERGSRLSLCGDLVVAEAGQAPLVVPLSTLLATLDEFRAALVVRAVVVLPNGRWVLHVAMESHRRGATDALIAIDRHGRAATTTLLRAYAWSDRFEQRVLAVASGVPGLAVFPRTGDDPFQFYPASAGAPPISHAWQRAAPITACGPRPARDAITLTAGSLDLRATVRVDSDTPIPLGFAWAQLEASDDGNVCARAFAWGAGHWQRETDAAHTVPFVRASVGAGDLLHGSAVTPDGLRTALCRITP